MEDLTNMPPATPVIGAPVIGAFGGDDADRFSETLDNLSSVAVARIVDVVAEGPIVGLVDGANSVYLDGVSLRALASTPGEGSRSVKAYSVRTTPGTPHQAPIPGFVGSQQEIPVGLKLSSAVGAVVRAVPHASAHAVRVTLSVSALSKTSPDDSSVSAAQVDYEIWARSAQSSWHQEVVGRFNGKTGSRYQQAHEIVLRGLGTGTGGMGGTV